MVVTMMILFRSQLEQKSSKSFLSSLFRMFFKKFLSYNFCFYSYICLDTSKKVVNIYEKNPTLYNKLENECLYNGQWKYDVQDWGCTGV